MKVLIALALLSFSSVKAQQSGFYNLKATTIDGKEFDFSSLKGKKVMIVNTASKCGLTPQYKDLQTLFMKYGGDSFVILGFPANDFLEQEPGSNDQIIEFCTSNYGVSFQMMSKISVKGEDMNPVYKWLTMKKLNGVMDAPVTWNFQKFLINEKGELEKMFPPKVNPLSPDIIAWIEGK